MKGNSTAPSAYCNNIARNTRAFHWKTAESADQKLHSLAQELNDAKAELTQLRVQQEQARSSTNTDLLLALPAVKKDAVVAGLQEQIAQQETLVNFYAMRYKEKYPKMIEARQRLDELKRSVAAAGLQARWTLDSVVEAARSRRKDWNAPWPRLRASHSP